MITRLDPPRSPDVIARDGHRAARRLERHFAESVRHDEAFTTASGTQALAAAIRAGLDLQSGPVALPAYDWIAASGAATMLGAAVAWCDVGPHGVITPETVADLADPPAVIVATDLLGWPVDVVGIAAVAPEAVIIEDATQAIGATRNGRPAGVDADIVVWSLGRGKLVDAIEGGAVAATSPALVDRLHDLIRHPATPPRLRSAALRGVFGRMHPLAAQLAADQLCDLQARCNQQRIAGRRMVALARANGVTTPPDEPGVQPSHHCPVAFGREGRHGTVVLGGLAYQAVGRSPNALRWGATARTILPDASAARTDASPCVEWP